MPYTKACAVCEASFVTPFHGQQHCSRSCADAARRAPRQPCGSCGKPIERPGRDLKYCSRACYQQQRLAQGALYRAEESLQHGYRRISVGGRRMFEHRYVMEGHLGRVLLPEEIIHHRDGNRLNNAIENLVLTGRSEHQRLLHRSYADATHKVCTRCRQMKPREEFPPAKKEATDSHMLHCIPCREITLAGRREKRRQSPTHANRLRPERYKSETEKTCVLCGEVKPRSEFWRMTQRTPDQDPNSPRCKVCASQGSKMHSCHVSDDQFSLLRSTAEECGVSASALLRDIIDRHFNRP